MEDVQLYHPAHKESVNDIGGVGDQPVTTDLLLTESVVAGIVMTDAEPVLEPPKAVDERFAEAKEAPEPEEPIVPDHYYDNGNVPVFKPVRFNILDLDIDCCIDNG